MQMQRATLFVCLEAVGWDGHDFTECVRPPPPPPPLPSLGLFILALGLVVIVHLSVGAVDDSNPGDERDVTWHLRQLPVFQQSAAPVLPLCQEGAGPRTVALCGGGQVAVVMGAHSCFVLLHGHVVLETLDL